MHQLTHILVMSHTANNCWVEVTMVANRKKSTPTSPPWWVSAQLLHESISTWQQSQCMVHLKYFQRTVLPMTVVALVTH